MPRLNSLTIFYSLGLAIVFSLWFLVQAQYAFNGNISWLLIAADRLVSGKSLLTQIYETNPPLSILIYTPHVIVARLLNISLVTGALYTTAIFSMLSVWAVHTILRPFSVLNNMQRGLFVLAYAIGITAVTTVYFSDREHLMTLGIMPLLLCQCAMNANINLPRKLILPTLFIGAICILVKPHYGILSFILWGYSLFQHKNLKTILRADFLILSATTISYIIVLTTLFSQYTYGILPDVWALYLGQKDPATSMQTISLFLMLYIALFFIELSTNDFDAAKKRFVLCLYGGSLLCLVPYFVQMKGFYNHVIPAQTLFVIGIAMSCGFRAPRIVKQKWLQLTLCFLATLLITIKLSPLSPSFMKKDDVKALPVAAYLSDECQAPCSFFVFHHDIEVFLPTAAHSNMAWASRFPTLWFLPELTRQLKKGNPSKALPLKKKYTDYILEDFKNFKPSIVLIARNISFGVENNFQLIEFLEESSAFKEYFHSNYAKAPLFSFDRADYFKGTSLRTSYIYEYDVYKRVSSPALKNKKP